MTTLSTGSIQGVKTMLISDKPIWVNADRSKVVEAESPEAAFLLSGVNGSVSDEDVKKYGLKLREPLETDGQDNTAPHMYETKEVEVVDEVVVPAKKAKKKGK